MFAQDLDTGENIWADSNATPAEMSVGMVMDPTSGIIYSINYNDDASGMNLCKADFSESGYNFTPVAPVEGNWNSLSCSADGQLYGIAIQDGEGVLHKIHKTTGALTEVGPTGAAAKYMSSATIDVKTGRPVRIVEKPENPESNMAVTGLYFYPSGVADEAAKVRPSARGELEITTLNEQYLAAGLLRAQCFGRGFAWLDTGTVDSLMEASAFIEAIQKRQGLKVAAIEEVAYRRGFISREELNALATPMLNNDYGQYLKALADEGFTR